MYRWFLRHSATDPRVAAIATLLVLVIVVVGPMLAVLGAGANEALRVTETVRPALERLVDRPGEFNRRLRTLAGLRLHPAVSRADFRKAGEVMASASAFIFSALSATTLATAVFIFHFVILLYTMFFFLTGGPALLKSVCATCRSTMPTRSACSISSSRSRAPRSRARS